MNAGVDEFDSSGGAVPQLCVDSVFGDARGYFGEVWNSSRFASLTKPMQLNHSYSAGGVVRGMHWQINPSAIGKYVTCLCGVVQDVVVDLRQQSKTFKRWKSYRLNSPSFFGNKLRHSVWVPAGFAHGFLVLSESAHVMYLQDGLYSQADERSFHYADPHIAIVWEKPLVATLKASLKDSCAPAFDLLQPSELF